MSLLPSPPDRPVERVSRISHPRLLHAYFDAQVRRRADHIAVEFGNESLTYRELDHEANQIAHELISRGVRPGSLVAIYLKKSPRLYATILGILKAGAGYVPIDPRFPLDRIRAILEDSSATVIATQLGLPEQLDNQIGTPILWLDRDSLSIARRPRFAPRLAQKLNSSHLCYVIYTSGSTGRPKGVMIEHRNAVAFVNTLKTVYRITNRDRIYSGVLNRFRRVS